MHGEHAVPQLRACGECDVFFGGVVTEKRPLGEVDRIYDPVQNGCLEALLGR